MRFAPPHRLIAYRHVLLAVALIAWAIGALVIGNLKGSATFPVARVVALAGLVFVWSNGLYWWVMLRYPRIDVGNGSFVSYDEWKGENHRLFFYGYWTIAVLASVACLEVLVNG